MQAGWEQVRRIFEQAVRLEGPEQLSFVRRACSGDDRLLREVLEMLEADGGTDSMLDRSVGALKLTDRTKLGPYRILSRLGAGGMGEVYRARDERLDRDVAIKGVAPELLADPAQLARFEREAKLLASLQHPNIAAVFGLEEDGGKPYIVMELVEGETLSARLRPGPRPLEEVLELSVQLAAALETAHERGIIHRDLKPANLMIDSSGRLKVLDFGLAKVAEPPAADAGADTPTASALTADGTLLGTAPYMSPEQARGHEADKRADIWAFGCILFEMLTGRSLFHRETVADTLTAILSAEPDWDRLPPSTPAELRRLIGRCLVKDPKRRLRDSGDVRVELEELLSRVRGMSSLPELSTAERQAAVRALGMSGPTRHALLPWALAGLVALAALSLGWFGRPAWLAPGDDATASALRFNIAPTRTRNFGEFPTDPYPAASPDGRRVAFVANTRSGQAQLWVQDLNAFDPRPLQGAVRAQWPFWSPDGRWIAFFADGELRKIPADGGPWVRLCDAVALGGSWGANDRLLFGTRDGLMQVSSNGGAPTPWFDGPDRIAQRFPHFLPDGRRFLFLQVGATPETRGIYLGEPDGSTHRLLPDVSNAMLVADDHVLFVRERTLLVQRFDEKARAMVGDPVSVASPLNIVGTLKYAPFSAASDLLLYRRSNQPATELTEIDRNGKALRSIGSRGFHGSPAVAPDGRSLVVARWDANANAHNLWQIDIDRGSEQRLSSGRSWEAQPVWSNQGRLFYASSRDGGFKIYEKNFGGGGVDRVVHGNGARIFPQSFSPDGAVLYYTEEDGSGPEGDIWQLPLEGGEPAALFNTAADESQVRVSPDGRWLAFASDETGRWEIYLRSLDPAGARRVVSSAGGTNPAWSADGSELFFLEPIEESRSSLAIDQKLMAVNVRTGPDLAISADPPRPLFIVRTPTFSMFEIWAFSPMPDGRSFVVNRIVEEIEAPLQVTLGWRPPPQP